MPSIAYAPSASVEQRTAEVDRLAASLAADIAEAITPQQRTCTGECGRTLPATPDYFYVVPTTGRMWLVCRDCIREQNRRRRLAGGNAGTRRMNRALQGEVSATLSDTRSFGVEIEFTYASQDRVRAAVQAAGLECDDGDYYSQSPGHWAVKSDGTSGVSGELVSPPLVGEAGKQQVIKACAALAQAGARVARCCGLHVHHDVSDFDLAAFKQAAANWSYDQSSIDLLVSESRRYNHFCSPLVDGEVQQIQALRDLPTAAHRPGLRVTRYRAFNVMSYPRYGTLEIRQHQGTTDAQKILAWVEFGQAFLAAARVGMGRTPTLDRRTLDRLLRNLRAHGLTRETSTYLRRRANRLYRRAGFTSDVVAEAVA